jgi:hypothetical protein
MIYKIAFSIDLDEDPSMARPKVSVEELLLRHRAIDQDQIRAAREQQKKVGGDLGRVLVELGYVSEELLLRAQSHQLGIPLVDPAQTPPPRALAQALPEQVCKRFGVIPVSGNLEAKLLRVATSAPANTERLATLAQETGYRIEIAAATADSIARAIRAAFSAPEPADEPHPPEIEPEQDDDLLLRLERLEKLLANPLFAGLVARVERLEQIAERDHHALNVLGQVLIDLGLISRDDLRKRLKP